MFPLFHLDWLLFIWLVILLIVKLFCTDNAGTNKAASSGTSLNTKRLDEDTENLTRECAYIQSTVS